MAKATDSAALEADALHFFSDMLASAVVLLGMVFVMLGFNRADAIAALIVACFIVVAAVKLGKRSFDSLMDTAPGGAKEEIDALLQSFPQYWPPRIFASATPVPCCSLRSPSPCVAPCRWSVSTR